MLKLSLQLSNLFIQEVVVIVFLSLQSEQLSSQILILSSWLLHACRTSWRNGSYQLEQVINVKMRRTILESLIILSLFDAIQVVC